LNPERRKNTAIQHRQSKFHNKKSSINFKKYLTKPRADKFYKSFDDNYKLEAVIRSIISGTPVVSICPHLHIDSSLIYKLLSSKLQIADTHKYMMTSDARRFGKIAEDCAADMFNGTYQKPHERVIPRLPFIVASPDYFSEKENKIIEIKSHGDKHKGVKLSILQTVIAMEAFEVSIGEIWFFITNKNEQNTRLVNIVKLNKTAELFNENVCKEAIQAYIYYLKILLETMNYSSSDEEIARTNSMLIKYSKKKKFYPLIAPPLRQTEFCRKVLQYVHVKIPKLSTALSKNDPVWMANEEYRNQSPALVKLFREQVANKLTIYTPIFTDQLFSQCKQINRVGKSLEKETVMNLCGYDDYTKSKTIKAKNLKFQNKTDSFTVFEITIDKNYIGQLLRSGVVVAHKYDRKYIQKLDKISFKVL